MLFRLQFIIRLDGASTAVAWPRQFKGEVPTLTHEPLDSVGFGSESVALSCVDEWLDRFPQIIDYEITDFVGTSHARV